jgi:predicted phosphodiesterase
VRLAIFSDVHGNSIALDAVLEDIARHGSVDGYLVLGDHTNVGPDPVGALERLGRLENARFVRGNGDRYVVTGDLPSWFETGKTDAEIAAVRVELAASLGWTRGAITAEGWYDWLAALPFELRFALPDGSRVLCVHATHRRDDEYTSLRTGATTSCARSCRTRVPSSSSPGTPTGRSIARWAIACGS